MLLGVRVIRRDTPGAVQVVTAKRPYPILWLPRALVEHGDRLRAGQRDLLIDVPDWLVEEKLEELKNPTW
jgi:hypothetical protein